MRMGRRSEGHRSLHSTVEDNIPFLLENGNHKTSEKGMACVGGPSVSVLLSLVE